MGRLVSTGMPSPQIALSRNGVPIVSEGMVPGTKREKLLAMVNVSRFKSRSGHG